MRDGRACPRRRGGVGVEKAVGVGQTAFAGRSVAAEGVAERSLPCAERAGLFARAGDAQADLSEPDRSSRIALLHCKPTLERAQVGHHVAVVGLALSGLSSLLLE